MELVIPILFSLAAFGLLMAGMAFRFIYQSSELFLFSMILSTIFFFVGGVCFIDVSYICPATGAIVVVQTYNWLIWLLIPFGFIPIVLMFESTFESFEGE